MAREQSRRTGNLSEGGKKQESEKFLWKFNVSCGIFSRRKLVLLFVVIFSTYHIMTTVAPTSGPAVAVEFAGGQLDAYMARDLDAVPELADLLDDTQAKATYYCRGPPRRWMLTWPPLCDRRCVMRCLVARCEANCNCAGLATVGPGLRGYSAVAASAGCCVGIHLAIVIASLHQTQLSFSQTAHVFNVCLVSRSLPSFHP